MCADSDMCVSLILRRLDLRGRNCSEKIFLGIMLWCYVGEEDFCEILKAYLYHDV